MPRVPVALLADYAVAHELDRKLYITGGGIRSLSFVAFPANVSRLALALGIELSPEELMRPHTMRIEATGPDEQPIVKPVTASFTVAADLLHPDQPVYFHFVANMENVTLPAEGEYIFSILIDDRQVEKLPLRVLTIAGNVSPAMEADIRVNEGRRAFGEGDIGKAEEIFRDVTTRFPTHATAHNNLGFVLLLQGKAEEAQPTFSKARETGFPQLDILDANVGCAYYLLGDAISASVFFQQCLRVRGFTVGAILLGIDDAHLFLVTLHSAADYVALMMLNLGWSALKTGDRATAARYVEGAEAADLGRREDPVGKNVSLSIQALKAQLG